MKVSQKRAIYYAKRQKAVSLMTANLLKSRLYIEWCRFNKLNKYRYRKTSMNQFCKLHNLPVITIKEV